MEQEGGSVRVALSLLPIVIAWTPSHELMKTFSLSHFLLPRYGTMYLPLSQMELIFPRYFFFIFFIFYHILCLPLSVCVYHSVAFLLLLLGGFFFFGGVEVVVVVVVVLVG